MTAETGDMGKQSKISVAYFMDRPILLQSVETFFCPTTPCVEQCNSDFRHVKNKRWGSASPCPKGVVYCKINNFGMLVVRGPYFMGTSGMSTRTFPEGRPRPLPVLKLRKFKNYFTFTNNFWPRAPIDPHADRVKGWVELWPTSLSILPTTSVVGKPI